MEPIRGPTGHNFRPENLSDWAGVSISVASLSLIWLTLRKNLRYFILFLWCHTLEKRPPAQTPVVRFLNVWRAVYFLRLNRKSVRVACSLFNFVLFASSEVVKNKLGFICLNVPLHLPEFGC